MVPAQIWKEQRQKALEEVRRDAAFEGVGYDIDPAAVALANANAKLAGVGDRCRFEVADVKDFTPASNATVLTNPPYGERLGDSGRGGLPGPERWDRCGNAIPDRGCTPSRPMRSLNSILAQKAARRPQNLQRHDPVPVVYVL